MKEHYKDFTENLKTKIVCQYGSVAEFCRVHGLCKFTLSKAFNGRVMNVSTFVKICVALGDFDFALAPDANYPEMPLIDYLDIRFNNIERSFIKVLIGL